MGWAFLQRHWSVFAIHFSGVMTYRLRTFVWFLVGCVNTVVLLLFWWATLSADPAGASADRLASITSYYVLLLLFATFAICHIEEDVAYVDIHKGHIYGYLLRPYPYLAIKFQQEVVWRFISAFWAVLTIVLLTLSGYTFAVVSSPFLWGLTVVSLVLGMLTSFFLKMCLGLMSIWVTNIRGIMDLYAVLEILFAGFTIPLVLFPVAFQRVVLLSPLATFLYYPVRILTTPLSSVVLAEMIAVQFFWMLFFGVLAQFLVTKGVRHYTGVSQ